MAFKVKYGTVDMSGKTTTEITTAIQAIVTSCAGATAIHSISTSVVGTLLLVTVSYTA